MPPIVVAGHQPTLDPENAKKAMNETVGQVAIDETGPIDYLVVEYPDGRPTGEALPYLIDLVGRGLIKILDVAFIVKSAEGVASAATLTDLQAAGVDSLNVFRGAASGLLDEGDVAQVGDILAPGSAGAILVYENSWAGPFAAALRRAGAQLVANGRIPVQAMIAALDATDEIERN